MSRYTVQVDGEILYQALAALVIAKNVCQDVYGEDGESTVAVEAASVALAEVVLEDH